MRQVEKLKVVSISDTHNQHEKVMLPEGDVLCHSGDFTNDGSWKQYKEFVGWLKHQPFKHKLICPGNHDLVCQTNESQCKDLAEANGIRLLVDDEIVIDGHKFYGSPYTKMFSDWAFEYRELELVELFERIPEDTQVLITHGPPAHILDKNSNGHSCGSRALYNRLHYKNIPSLSYVLFGHIHESFGVENYNLGLHEFSSVRPGINFANVALCGGREFHFHNIDPSRRAYEFELKRYSNS